MKKDIKILFVCHGNICRSPMAEFVMKDICHRAGRSFYIRSAATSREELGNPVYPPARRVLSAHGIDCAGKTARQITKTDYQDFDIIVGMDSANIRNMQYFWGGNPQGKVHKLLQFAGIDRDVADPWYTDDFDTTWKDVVLGCTALLKYIEDYLL